MCHPPGGGLRLWPKQSWCEQPRMVRSHHAQNIMAVFWAKFWDKYAPFLEADWDYGQNRADVSNQGWSGAIMHRISWLSSGLNFEINMPHSWSRLRLWPKQSWCEQPRTVRSHHAQNIMAVFWAKFWDKCATLLEADWDYGKTELMWATKDVQEPSCTEYHGCLLG